ncbi:imidazolonepropionase [Pseudogemmatithrix spongiicola]|uniref:Imidazolonepropionase n=1 Tax=Pseudogemmatithrix spongiicola TaxID=3062599 RepID=A0AA49Q5T7_9BACT|nr:imidazolonepropionase [Gemmatimonadaceae bacterium 'strain 138']WKW15417.1 imidazolonepropionase [Gemmatimonadaceae bacterium 'strain 318']
MPTLLLNASEVVTCEGPPRARRAPEMTDAGVRANAAVAMGDDGRILAVGPDRELRAQYPGSAEIDCARGVLTPGFVDSHTHAIFGRSRHAEQELRAAGVGYMEIAKRGGGIHSSVRDLRERSEDELVALAASRLARLAAHGSTTIEVKSGYGLSLESELRTLRVIRRLAAELPVRLVPTFLGAHEIPLEYREAPRTREDYIALLVEEMLPAVARESLARFCDIFCEPGVYSAAEARRILGAARGHGMALKLHADELEHAGAAELAAEIGATSADHLAAVSELGIKALAASGTVATLLPGTMLFLGRSKQAPARAMLDAGCAIALASDFNPGTSPTVNFPLILTLGVSQLRLSVAEAFVAATVNGAAALGLAHEIGQLAPGFSADVALFDVEDHREIPYWYGDHRCVATWVRGRKVLPAGQWKT